MNKLAASIAAKKIGEATNEIMKAAEEEITMSKKVYALEIAVALLGGIVIGMFLSPRKKVSYKIASNNNINSCDDEDAEYDEYDEEDDDEQDDRKKIGKLIKL